MIKRTTHTSGYQARNQRGVALLVVLIMVLVFAGSVAAALRYSGVDAESKRARTAGDQIALLTKAGRIYGRDMAATNANFTTTLSAAPQLVSIDELIQRRLLPPDFGGTSGRIDANHYNNVLGQTMEVVLANSPVSGAANAPTTVATAYVLLGKLPAATYSNVEAERMTGLVAQRMKEQGIPVNAPTYNSAGQLLVACGGVATPGAFVGSWDTGCLSAADYAVLSAVDVANLPAANDFQGAMVVPTWRSTNDDTRALSRFAQPENPTATAMATNLYMARAATGANPWTGGSQQITMLYPTANANGSLRVTYANADGDSNTAGTQTVPVVANDTAVQDNRFNLNNVSALQGISVIAQRQATRFGGAAQTGVSGTPITAKLQSSLNVASGTTLVDNTLNPPVGALAPLTVLPDANISGNVVLNSPNAGGTPISVAQNTTVGDLSAKNLNGTNLTVPSGGVGKTYDIGVQNATNATTVQAGTAATQILTNQITASGGVTAETARVSNLTTPEVQNLTGAGARTWSGSSINAPVVVGVASGFSYGSVIGTTTLPDVANSVVRVSPQNTYSVKRIDTNICASNMGSQCPSGRGEQICTVDPSTGLTVCKPSGGVQ